MNLQNLVDAVTSEGYSFPNLITDALHPATMALNSTYRRVLGLQRWPFLEKQDTSITTVVGTDSYPISSITDARQIDAVRLEKVASQVFINIINMEPQDFRDNQQIDRTADVPRYWTMHHNNFMLWPVPNDTYTLRIDYIYDPPDLVAASDVPVLPTKYHDVLVWGAVFALAYRERDWLGRNFAQEEFRERLKELQSEYLLRQRQTSSHVKRSGSWDTTVQWPYAGTAW